ncbi:MAG: LamG-like jellyroll fold domain-containing protein, partial [Acidimicrobiales bacterium]
MIDRRRRGRASLLVFALATALLATVGAETAPVGAAAPVITTALSGHWTLDDGSGATVADGTINGNDGSLAGDPGFVGGVRRTALDFDGNDRVDIADPIGGELDFGSGDFSVSFWVVTDQNPSSDVALIHKLSSGGGATGWAVWLTPGGTLRADIETTTDSISIPAAIVNTGRWHHVVLRRQSGAASVFVDGLSTAIAPVSGSVDNAEPVRLAQAGPSEPGLDGRLDEVSMYGRSLSPAEVDALGIEVLEVNDTSDGVDLVIGDGVCDTGGVNSEGRPECTLRAALAEANATAAIGSISFAIPTTDLGHAGGVWAIEPASPLPQLASDINVDATTQPGYSGAPVVNLDGGLLTVDLANSGLTIGTAGAGASIRGLAITAFGNDAIQTRADSVTIEDNYIGVLPDGTTGRGNQSEGIIVFGTALGTTIRRNLIGANPNAAVALNGDSRGSVVQGNIIGTDPSRTVSLPNGQAIWSDTTGTALIGGINPGEGNILVNSLGDAIEVRTDGARLSIVANEIAGNGQLGIDLGTDGVPTPNDVGDLDTGPNQLMNFPVITSATASAGTIDIDYDLDLRSGNYRVEFYANPSGGDPSFYGEGEVLVGFALESHLGAGTESFSTSVPGAAGDLITATVTETKTGNEFGATSEFSLGTLVAATVQAVVNSTGDAADVAPGDNTCDTGALNATGNPECTLRAAIEEVNAAGLVDDIVFAIPTADAGHTAGRWTISPLSPLPGLGAGSTVDGSTQPGHSSNTVDSPGPSNAVMAVSIDGSSAGTTDGLVLQGDLVTVRGLVVNGFDGRGVVLNGDDGDVAEVYVGIAADGSAAVPNTGDGVAIIGNRGRLGGPAPDDRVVVSGNGGHGIVIGGDDAGVWGSIVGLDAATTTSIKNGRNGIRIPGSTNASIGAVGAGNVISGNTDSGSSADGFYITGGGGHVVQANLIGTNDVGASLGNYNAGLAI